MVLRARARLAGSHGGRLASTLAATVTMLSIAMTAQASAASFGAGLIASPLASSGAPTVSGLEPSIGPETGGTEVIVRGSKFTGATAVEFGTTSVSFTVTSRSKIAAIAPAGAGLEDVRVTTPAGTSAIVAGDEFTYTSPEPTVRQLTPDEGNALGGAHVRIAGTNLTGATAVYFGAHPVKSFTVESSGLIVTKAAWGYGTVDVTVVTPEGTSAITPGDEFSYRGVLPAVSGVGPNQGPAAGGNTVSVSGNDFTGVTAVSFGDATAPSFVVSSPTSLSAVAPPDTAGKVEVSVTTIYGTSTGVWCQKGRPCIVNDYYKFIEPTIAELSPDSGPEAGGTSVTVTGTGFGIGLGATTFTFDSEPASEVECIALTMCTLLTPPHKAASVLVKAAVGEYAIKKQSLAARYEYTR
jgi:hypothetical protein